MLNIVSEDRGINPKVGWLNVNRACNMRCEWCYAKGTEYSASSEMSLDLAIRLVGMMRSAGVKNVTLIGGEPTLWEPLFDFNDFCNMEEIRTTLVTNGTRFGRDTFWQEYQESPSSTISLSIKAFDESSFKCVTGTSAFELTRLGMQRALSTQGCRASIVYTGNDRDELIQIARFAASCGAKSLGISSSTPAYVHGNPDVLHATQPQKFIDGIVIHYDELHELFEGRISIALKLPLCIWPRQFIIKLIERSQITTTCQLQHRSGLLFDTDGTVISCNSLHDFPLGKVDQDFHDTGTLEQHLHSDAVLDFYDKVNTYASPKCVSCSVKAYCGGGCPLFYGVYDADELIPGWD
jgi:radical SAM protein with 4Fe4S-binding SPASM domain